MAEVVVDLPPANPGGMPGKYPWDDWLDGRVWHLEGGKDFTVALNSMRSMVRASAIRAGKTVTVRRHGDDLIIQARP